MNPALSDQRRGHCSYSGRGAGSSRKAMPPDENSLTTLLNSFRRPLPANIAVLGLNVLHDDFDTHIGLAPAQASTTDQVVNFDGFSRTETADVDVTAVINMFPSDSDTLFNFSTAHSLEHREAVGGMDSKRKPAVRTRKQPKQKQGLNGISQVSPPPGLEDVAVALADRKSVV